MERPLVTIAKLSKPVIAQVQGVAAANGMGLVAACDVAIAADNAKMGLTAINVGLNCVGPVIPVSNLSAGRRPWNSCCTATWSRRRTPWPWG